MNSLPQMTYEPFHIAISPEQQLLLTATAEHLVQHTHFPFHPPHCSQNYVVVEEIREMTSAISYIHIVIPLNIQGFIEQAEQANQYTKQILEFMKQTKERHFHWSYSNPSITKYNEEIRASFNEARLQHIQMVEHQEDEGNEFQRELNKIHDRDLPLSSYFFLTPFLRFPKGMSHPCKTKTQVRGEFC
jgi:hypothetical protein